jgi:uncharacterized membrane protein
MKPHCLSQLTKRNVAAIAQMDKASEEQRTFGERMADGIAATVGSWPFLMIQTILLAIWVVLNVVAWAYQWDPYPFILLNLLLSFQAAYASPIIMMSQNRQAKLNERRNHLDLQINLLAEQEGTEILRLLRKLCDQAGVAIENESSLRALEQATKPENLVHQMEQATECAANGDQAPPRTPVA